MAAESICYICTSTLIRQVQAKLPGIVTPMTHLAQQFQHICVPSRTPCGSDGIMET